jgi:hypothetical protein
VIATKARELLTQARKDELYEGPIPEDDDKAISEAAALVEMAKTAWNQYVRGPEVTAILSIAGEDGDAPEHESNPEPEPEPEVEIPNPEEAIETKEDLPGDAALTKVEPWEGYANDGVKDIKAGIESALKEYPESELADLLGHIWAYEEANKNRLSVLKYLETVAEEIANRPPEGEVEIESPLPDEDAPETDKIDEVAPPVPIPDNEPISRINSDIQPEEVSVEPSPEQETPANDGVSDELLPGAEIASEMPINPNARLLPEEVPQEIDEEPDDYYKLVDHVETELSKERAQVPQSPPEDIPELPWDWTKMTDKELQHLYGVYTSLSYYKNFVLAREERMAMHCKQAADEMHSELLLKLEKYDDHNKPKTMTLLEAEIESLDDVKAWRRRQRKHDIFATAARQERDSYNKIVESLSRLESMRANEWERAGKQTSR